MASSESAHKRPAINSATNNQEKIRGAESEVHGKPSLSNRATEFPLSRRGINADAEADSGTVKNGGKLTAVSHANDKKVGFSDKISIIGDGRRPAGVKLIKCVDPEEEEDKKNDEGDYENKLFDEAKKLQAWCEGARDSPHPSMSSLEKAARGVASLAEKAGEAVAMHKAILKIYLEQLKEDLSNEEMRRIISDIEQQARLIKLKLKGKRTLTEKPSKNQERRIEKLKQLLRLEHLETNQSEEILKVLENFSDTFFLPGDKMPATNLLEHEIPTINNIPIRVKQFRHPPILKEEINKQVKEMLEKGVIEPSTSAYSAPVFCVDKKPGPDGKKKYRVVVDFRKLNAVIPDYNHPVPNISDILDQLGNAKYFSVFDLYSGYHQIKIKKEDREKTAFLCDLGLFHFIRSPFGLKTSAPVFLSLVLKVITGLKNVVHFFDDICVFSSTFEEHLETLTKLFIRLRQANLVLQPEKCEFLKEEITYLGHIISKDGLRPDPNKVKAVKEFPRPKNPKNIKQFLGLVGYYRRFIKNFAKIAKPLTNLLKKDNKFKWEAEEEEAFSNLRDAICNPPILAHPDFSKKFIVTTDASGYAIGAVLSQGEIGKDRPIAFVSRALSNAEKNYCTFSKEALAIIYAISQFRPYLYGNKFTLVTDHRPLTWLRSQSDPSSRVTRWRLKLMDYQFDVVYKKGELNSNADALSRNPIQLQVETNDEVSNASDSSEGEGERLTNTETALGDPIPGRATVQVIQTRSKTGILPSGKFKKAIEALKPRKKARTKGKSNKIVKPASENADAEQEVLESDEKGKNAGERAESAGSDDISKTPAKVDSILPEAEDTLNDKALKNDEPGDERDSNLTLAPFTNVPRPEINQENEEEPNTQEKHREPLSTDRIIFCKEKIFMRKDNYLYFINTLGEPLDDGAKDLMRRNKLPRFENLKCLQPSVVKENKKYHIAIPLRNDTALGLSLTMESLEVGIRSAIQTCENYNLTTVSLAKSEEIDHVEFREVIKILKKNLETSALKVIICTGVIKYPETMLRQNIIAEAHCSAAGGHKGVNKTINRIKHKYKWENMKEEVQLFIQKCVPCQTKKLVRVKVKQKLILTDFPSIPFCTVSLDIVGPMRRTKNNNEYILTMQDQFTKFSVGAALNDQTAESVADAFIKKFICTFGAPQAVLTDQGTNFLSKLMKRVAKRFKIKQIKTTAFHPQTNGSLERSHAPLSEYLKMFACKNADWDEWVELAMFSYNTGLHESTQHTPYELVFGRLARIPANDPIDAEDMLPTYAAYMTKLIQKLNALHDIARERTWLAKQKNKEYYDKKAKPLEIKIGDYVWLQKGPKPNKLEDQYTGPYLVTEIWSNGNVRIKISKTKQKIVHSNRLRFSHVRATRDENEA